jgi:hypothetical protein
MFYRYKTEATKVTEMAEKEGLKMAHGLMRTNEFGRAIAAWN